MTTRVDVEEIETTRSEKLLATVLTVFILIGLLWVYFHVDVDREYDFRVPAVSASDRAALDRHARAAEDFRRARSAQSARRRDLVDRREAYRTALDEGRRSAVLERRYHVAETAYARAQQRRQAARQALVATQAPARSVQARIATAQQRAFERIDARRAHDGRVSLARRLAFVLIWLAGAYLLLGRLRRRRSRWFVAATAPVAAVALLALVMAVDYLTDYVEVTDLGLLVLSAAGALMTIAATAVLQRYLARRLPERRVRHRECPFCGYPTGSDAHCEGCGRDVVGACAACSAPRRVGTRHCGACGAA